MVADFSADTTIIPKESAIFSDFNLTSTLLPFNETKTYIDDTIGLKELNEANKLYIRHCIGDHIDINDP